MNTVLRTIEALEAELHQEVYRELQGVWEEAASYNPEDIDDGDGPSIDVRLQVLEDGTWALHSGDAQYDADHHGFWGAWSVSPDDDESTLQNTARELVNQVLEHAGQSES